MTAALSRTALTSSLEENGPRFGTPSLEIDLCPSELLLKL